MVKQSKILEKLITIQLTNHLELNNLLYQHQYGFQCNKSTLHNLTHLTNYIYSGLTDKKYCIGLFLDLRKAFNVCSNSVLLKKFRKYGIHAMALHMTGLLAILKTVNNKLILTEIFLRLPPFNISVIQGSILEPILFLVYMNDLYNTSDLFKLKMFADDTAGLA
jgi:hypothetical protein